MEPGHEDREYPGWWYVSKVGLMPQWSPVMKTGNTHTGAPSERRQAIASMEPGHEDREYRQGGHRAGPE